MSECPYCGRKQVPGAACCEVWDKAELAECEKQRANSMAREEEAGKRIKGYQTTIDFQQNRISELDATLAKSEEDVDVLCRKLSECQRRRDGYREALKEIESLRQLPFSKIARAALDGFPE